MSVSSSANDSCRASSRIGSVSGCSLIDPSILAVDDPSQQILPVLPNPRCSLHLADEDRGGLEGHGSLAQLNRSSLGFSKRASTSRTGNESRPGFRSSGCLQVRGVHLEDLQHASAMPSRLRRIMPSRRLLTLLSTSCGLRLICSRWRVRLSRPCSREMYVPAFPSAKRVLIENVERDRGLHRPGSPARRTIGLPDATPSFSSKPWMNVRIRLPDPCDCFIGRSGYNVPTRLSPPDSVSGYTEENEKERGVISN